jgi:cytosine/adenosine deaminase-related metal-dependent hydrolase
MASLRDASDRSRRSSQRLSSATIPYGRARIGWMNASPTVARVAHAALLADIRRNPTVRCRPISAAVSGTPNRRLRGSSTRQPSEDPTQIHAIGARPSGRAQHSRDGGALTVHAQIEHVQLLDGADLGRFAAAGIVASVQPVHLGSDAAQARKLWGERAERNGYTWGSLAATGAVLAFGTDSPVEPFDPWPGIALAVRREDPRWPAGTPEFGPHESLSLDRALRAACVGPALSTRETDRGRLAVGHRADVVVIPGACLDDPVEPGGALSTARPSIVVLDGRVVDER